MSPEALLNGLTTIPAHSLGLDGVKGNLNHGADADLLIISAGEIRDMFYDWTNTQVTVIQEGKVLDMKKIMRKSIKP
jgi:imidazolonepropionase